MNREEFERQYQEAISEILNELQSMAIISNRLETTIIEVGSSVQQLNQMVDQYIKSQTPQADESSSTNPTER